MTNLHDVALYCGLKRLRRSYDGLLATRQTPLSTLNAKKAILDAQWQAELEPVMRDLYWHPLRNGVDSAPDDEDDLHDWLSDSFKDAAVIAVLLLLLRRYQVKALNLGGQTGLDFLGLSGVFNLTNAQYLKRLDDHATMLTSQGTEMSLIDTTINDLTQAIQVARQGAGSTLMALGSYIGERAALRTILIERTERPRQVANGLNWTYSENGVRLMMYDVNGVGCPKICEPLHGRITPVDNPDPDLFIPQHPGCDCVWSSVLDGWTPPDNIWRGE